MKEIWNNIIGFEGLYQVSNLGRVKSLGNNKSKKERILKPIRVSKSNGYYRIHLSKNGKSKLMLLHRIVAIHFIPNPLNYPEVNHIEGNKEDCRASKLEWVTRSLNKIHAYKIGLIKPYDMNGESGPNAKLTQNQVNEIRDKYTTGMFTHNALAELYNTSRMNITHIINLRRWAV